MTDPKPTLADALYRYVTLRDDQIVTASEVELGDAEAEVDRAAERVVNRFMRGAGESF